jgi:hypothetical protein
MPTAAASESRAGHGRLRQRWPEYVKGMPAMRLADQIDHGAIARVQLVEAELADFLANIGYTEVP